MLLETSGHTRADGTTARQGPPWTRRLETDVQGEFSISRTQVDGVPTVSVEGDLDLSNSSELRQHLQEAAAEGAGPVAVDLSGVRFFDSSAARVLLREWHEGLLQRRPLRITSASLPVRRVLTVLLDRSLFPESPLAS